LDALLPPDHPARAIWAFLERLDLSAFYGSLKVVADRPGRPASDPRVLLALWIFATVQGVGKARQLARLCEEHDAYRWIRGGVPVDYHLLSSFRVDHHEALDRLLTQIVAALLAQGLVTLEEVAQDGVRIRASAGASSFRKRTTLAGCLALAEARVAQLAAEPDEAAVTARQQAARERAARGREERVRAAVGLLPELERIKERQRQKRGKAGAKVKEARASTTDADARVMRMGDGGYRPAYNGQFATDHASQVILGVGVSTAGADQGEAGPMAAQVAERTGQHPARYLIDGGFVDRDDITHLEQQGVAVYAPRPAARSAQGPPPEEPHAGDSPEVEAWRARMGSEAARTLYQDRAATAECVNAQLRVRYGVTQLPVRGRAKVLTVLLLVAVTHNLSRWIALTAGAAG
jgi:transposase